MIKLSFYVNKPFINQDSDAAMILTLMSDCRSRDIKLWVEDGQLKYRTPVGGMTSELREKLKSNMREIIDALSQPLFVPVGKVTEIQFLDYRVELWGRICSNELGVWFTNGTHCIFDVEEPFSLIKYQTAVNIITEMYPILGTKVDDSNGQPKFIFGHSVSVEYKDLPELYEDPNVSVVTRAVSNIVWRPFDARNEVLFRPFVIRVSSTRHIVGFVLHHLIGDATSVSLLVREIMLQYRHPTPKDYASLKEPTLQYSDYINGMNVWLHTLAKAHRMNYWREYLFNSTASRIPPDHIVEPQTICESRTKVFSFGLQRTEALFNISQSLEVRILYVLIALHASAMHICTGQSDILILTMHHGRDDESVASIIGSMQNQLFCRVRFSETSTFEDVVRAVQKDYMLAIEHQIASSYVLDMMRDINASDCFPELNNFVTNIPIWKIDRAPIQGADDQLSGFTSAKVFHSPPDPPLVFIAGKFPGHKLSFWADQLGIHGSVEYLSNEYEDLTISNYIDTILRIVDDSCRPVLVKV